MSRSSCRVPVHAALLLLAITLSCGEASARCAFVNLGIMPGYVEPQRHCFDLERTCPPGSTHGCFKTALEFKPGWIEKSGQPRLRELSKPFGYIDPKGVHWDVPAGAATDGASIPLVFQAVIGGPWTESYVKAATLHDFYIRRSSVKAAEVHEMFYLALLATGTSQWRAGLMYGAVDTFGPRWKDVDVGRVDEIWRTRKAWNDKIVQVHKEMWDAHQEIERKRAAQAAIDRAVLSRPLSARTRVHTIRNEATALADFDAFIAAATRDQIVHLDRDASLIASLREQLEAELRRPASERDNVFVLRFMRAGATFSRFAARNQAELAQALALDAQISEQLDGAVIDAIAAQR
jgi:Protein of unknown function (DUF1353)